MDQLNAFDADSLLSLLIHIHPLKQLYQMHRQVHKLYSRFRLRYLDWFHFHVRYRVQTFRLFIIVLLTLTLHSYQTYLSIKPEVAFAKSLLSQTTSSPNTHIFFLETTFNGLGAQYLRLISALSLTDHLHTPLCRPAVKYWNYGCGLFQGPECYFEPSPCTETCSDPIELSDVSSHSLPPCIKISTPASANYTTTFLETSPVHNHLPKIRQLAAHLWRLNNRTETHVQYLLRPILPANIEYVGLHIRRGDKMTETKPVLLSVYIHAVTILASKNDTPVFVATDDGTVLPSLRKLMPGRKVLSLAGVEKRHGHLQKHVNARYLNRNYQHVVELIAEIEALRHATWFVGTFSSNLARLVHVLRYQHLDTSVSLDDRWQPGPAWKTFGQPYCEGLEKNVRFCQAMGWYS